jgi:hypothetical protein
VRDDHDLPVVIFRLIGHPGDLNGMAPAARSSWVSPPPW